MRQGNYQVMAKGHENEEVPITVKIKDDKIVDITPDKPVSSFAKEVFDTVPAEIIDNQSVNVDVVSGATQTSNGIIAGVKEAIASAGGNVGDFQGKKETTFSGFEPGIYAGSSDSLYGPVKVKVEVDTDRLKNITVTEVHDSAGVGTLAAKIIPERMVESQSIDVDAVTGATRTSMAITSATKKALKQASENLPQNMTKHVEYKAPGQKNIDADVLIIGGGIAGMSSLQRVAHQGLKAVLVERNEFLGGDALISGQYYTITDVEDQLADRYEIVDTYKKEGLGIQLGSILLGLGKFDTFTATSISKTGEEMIPSDKSITTEIVKEFERDALEHGAKILTNNLVKKLLIKNGKVEGAIVQPKGRDEYQINAKKVLLTTGGFANNSKLVAKYMPKKAGAPYEGLPGEKGDAFSWIKPLNAKTDLATERASFYPADSNTGLEGMYWSENHFISKSGKLLDKGTYYNATSMRVYEKIGREHYYLLVTDDEVKEVKSSYDYGVKQGRYYHFDNAAEADKKFNMPDLKDTLTKLKISLDEPFYMSEVESIIYGTYTGIVTNKEGQLLDKEDHVIPNLYAAGEVSGNRSYRQTDYYDGGLASGLVGGYAVGNQIVRDFK